ncbi:hypothetical protein EMPS_08273 [Entomortierella parvispora]|uniref:F-box domain-containing protein n=1 Tax=Entomortierella parvispora TaxID=205924 RepID=A0A9P3HFP5_9FUNG|nr:hypothetical protein EMPS_08273 [Entomortierella parvispora]
MHSQQSALERVLGLPELHLQVERYLSIKDLSRCCQVSRFFYALWNRTLWSKIRTGRHGLPEFLDKYCHWVESWERMPTAGGYTILDELDQVRTSCYHLSKAHISFSDLDPCGFMRHFMGLTEERVEEGGTEVEDNRREKRYFGLFVPGRVIFLDNDDNDGSLTRQWLHGQPPQQFVPKSSHSEDAPLALALPNAFLSNQLRLLELASPGTNLPLLDWLTRAAVEGHLQGLERFKFKLINNPWVKGWNTSRSSILQFLGACPRLLVYDAPDVVVKGDEPRVLLNADIATAYPTGPWTASHFQAKGGSRRKMIPLKELYLAAVDLYLVDEDEYEDDDGQTVLLKKDRLMMEFFLHLPRLVRLTFHDEVEEETTIQALELAYLPHPSLSVTGGTIPDLFDRARPISAFPPCEGSPARFFSDQEYKEREDQRFDYYRLEHFRNLGRDYGPHVGLLHESIEYTILSRGRFVTFPWLKLSRLEFSSPYSLPDNFLEILSEQESIRRHLRSFVINISWNPVERDGTVSFLYLFKAKSISRFLSSCDELREIHLPISWRDQSGFFTVEESSLWSRPWMPLTRGGKGLEENTGCRDKLEIVKFVSVRLDYENDGGVTENEAFREWMASLKSLRSLTIHGAGIHLEALIDLSLPSTPSADTLEKKELVCGQLRELQISTPTWNKRLNVNHVQRLARRMPKLRYLSLPEDAIEPEAEEWIENYCPRLSNYVEDGDESDEEY